MWNIIPQIGTPIALIAFAMAIFYLYQRQWLKKRLEAIQSVPSDERADLVELILDKLHIDANGLTQTQRYTLIQQRLTEKANVQKMVIIGMVIICLTALFVVTDVYREHPETKRPIVYKELLAMLDGINPPETVATNSDSEPDRQTTRPDTKSQQTTVDGESGCVVTTKMMTRLYDKPDVFNSTALHSLPSHQEYKVMAQEIYHHGPMDIRFFQIRDSDGVEGWVSAQELEKIHPDCLK